MKQQTKTFKTNMALAFLVSLFALVIVSIITKPTILTQEAVLELEKLETSNATLQGTIYTNGVHEDTQNVYYYEYTGSGVNKTGLPSINGVQLYCIEHGGRLQSLMDKTVSSIRTLAGTTGTVNSTSHPASLPANKYSNPYFQWESNKSEVLNAVTAYMITAPSDFVASTTGTFSDGSGLRSFSKGENISQEVRQVAIWLNSQATTDTSRSWGGNDQFSYLQLSQQLSDEAEAYQAYETKLQSYNSAPLTNKTISEPKVNVNTEGQYFIIGPYRVEYIDGKASTATFAGISNIQVKGYNDEGKTSYIKNVEVLSYIQDGTEKTLQYYEPSKENGYVDHSEQSYPVSGKEFYLKIKNPNQGVEDANKKVNYLDVSADYSYMTASGIKRNLNGYRYYAYASETSHEDTIDETTEEVILCKKTYQWKVGTTKAGKNRPQYLMDAWGERKYYTCSVSLGVGKEPTPLNINMKLGGYVWEDIEEGKESQVKGQYGPAKETDSTKRNEEAKDYRPITNVKVTLYECILDQNGNVQYKNGSIVSKVADLLSDVNESKMSASDIQRRVNPQLTGTNGYYRFDGLDASQKYYVTFEYNGQVYMPTEYLVTAQKADGSLIQQNSVQDMVVNAKLYNSDTWKVTSKITEDQEARTTYNTQFAEIGSSPKNYVSSNSLNSGKLVKDGTKHYNETFTIEELMGFELQADGTYQYNRNKHLIDGFYALDNNGNIVETNQTNIGRINQEIRSYINKNAKYPDETAMLEIYKKIAGDDVALWKKLQYIEDCKMTAYTGSPLKNGTIDLYPVYNDFTLDTKAMTIPGVGTKPSIYLGQYYVNAGLWKRAQVDLALRKDVYKATTRINGKTEVYNYDKREEDKDYWQINIRLQDYDSYYGTNYNREIYTSDYNYNSANTNKSGKELELYVTYKITVHNASKGVLAQVTEVVDYYDNDYIYQPDLSWVMYENNVSKDKYETMMSNLSKATDIFANENAKAVNAKTESTYGKATQSDLEKTYNSLYITALQDKILATGEEAYIYLTFKVKGDDKGPVILDDSTSLKENYAEINGYKTFYADGTVLPNNIKKSSNDVAGLIDYNSNPGNLAYSDIFDNNGNTYVCYEKNFENDTDRAKSIKVTLEGERIISGIVWEDERTKNVSGAMIGDGIRQASEIGVNGVTVQLVEKIASNQEYVWQTATTTNGGKYEFSNIIPGDYIVRFIYGDTKDTVLTTANGGKNAVSYNGQDFKSTVYQKDMTNNTEITKTVKDNVQYYNITAADQYKYNLSDAKDVWTRRTAVNNYSTGKITNNKAEVLAAPYAQTINQSYVDELIKNTNMTAETDVIVLEGEYNRTNTDGEKVTNGNTLYLNGNDINGTYQLQNVDFGLTERPKAQLELNNKVVGVKLTHSDGVVAFDTTKAVTDVIWLAKTNYNLSDNMKNNKYNDYYTESSKDAKYNRYSYRDEISESLKSRYTGNNGLIQISKDEELMHGATIEITYAVSVANVGEKDYTGQDFYYKGTVGSGQLVTTSVSQVLDYVPNNLQYRAAQNQGWTLVKASDIINNKLVNDSLKESVNKFNTILVSETETTLRPGESTSAKNLVLTQVITPENTNDDRKYETIAEIVETSNSIGRRMAYSIAGNQNPTQNPAEVDSSKAESVIILPPTGELQIYAYIGIGALAILILIGGVLIIKKKVLKK